MICPSRRIPKQSIKSQNAGLCTLLCSLTETLPPILPHVPELAVETNAVDGRSALLFIGQSGVGETMRDLWDLRLRHLPSKPFRTAAQ